MFRSKILLVLGTYVVKDCIHCGQAVFLNFFIYRSWFFKTVIKYTILSNFELCMIRSFVAPNKPRMVDDKVNGVTYVIIEMTEDEDEYHKKTKQIVFDIIFGSVEILLSFSNTS